ncbi:MAG: ATP-dependent helicase, partial [Bacteroidetes bacterium]|nr:ATP-dependent helicase [Bacteroidota bacterium]
GRGGDNLIVGDIKQSIYRWRNSDWRILEDLQNDQVDNKRIFSKPLVDNWRSRSDIIRFNNTLFSVIPLQADRHFSDAGYKSEFVNLYTGSVQSDPGKRKGGYIRLDIIDEDPPGKEDCNSNGYKNGSKSWKENVLDRIPGVIEMFQDHGYQASDIGIIVREVREGEAVVRRMIDYSNNCSPDRKSMYNYTVVSDDSLSLSSSHAINFIIAVLRVMCDPEDMISRAQMVRFYGLTSGDIDAGKINLFLEVLRDGFHGYFPEEYEQFLGKMRNRPLFEITESIISFFDLGTYPGNVAYLDTFQDQVLNFSRSKSSDTDSFLEWWDTTGSKKSISLPSNQNAARILTIHKAKGLEFKVVILPFLSWNLDYVPGKQPVLWIKPAVSPFNDLGIVPVRYSSILADTIFADDYNREKYFSYIDNINLLYVAMTRAKDALYGFVPGNAGKSSTIAGIIKNALASDENPAASQGLVLNKYFDSIKGVFEYGEIPVATDRQEESEVIISESYTVNSRPESLKLRLHGEDYFAPSKEIIRHKINYGNLMHEAFEGINTHEDIPAVLRKLIREGKIGESEYNDLEKRLNLLISSPVVAGWFEPGINILKEAEILTPSGNARRPDRVIIKDGKTIVIDFKFGEENQRYNEQAELYRSLLAEMGYGNIEAFLWYADKNKIVAV